jgi:hypothetical protein
MRKAITEVYSKVASRFSKKLKAYALSKDGTYSKINTEGILIEFGPNNHVMINLKTHPEEPNSFLIIQNFLKLKKNGKPEIENFAKLTVTPQAANMIKITSE